MLRTTKKDEKAETLRCAQSDKTLSLLRHYLFVILERESASEESRFISKRQRISSALFSYKIMGFQISVIWVFSFTVVFGNTFGFF